MNLLDWINQGIDALTNTASPSIDALGFHIFVALLTAMMVWFGVQEALASAQGATGFNMAKFVHFVVMGSFTYTLIEFYHSAIPGVGYSFHDFITVGATSVANMIGQDSINQMLKTINDLQGQAGSDILKAIMNTYYAIVVVMIQVLLAIFSAVIAAIVAYGVLAAAVAGLLGPLFIPFLLVDKLNFLFWGWLRAFIGVQLLQDCSGSGNGHSWSSLHALLHGAYAARSGDAHRKNAALDLADRGEYLPAFQDSCDHEFNLLWPHRPWWRIGDYRPGGSFHLTV